MHSKSFKFPIAICAVIIISALIYISKTRIEPYERIPDTITNFAALNVTDGNRTSFEKEKGTATLIVLSASWCPACIAEIPVLKKLYTEYFSQKFKIIMISEDDNIKIAAKFKKSQQLPWTVLLWNYELMNQLGNPRVIPVSYLIDTEGNIVYVEAGIIDEEKMRSKIERIIE